MSPYTFPDLTVLNETIPDIGEFLYHTLKGISSHAKAQQRVLVPKLQGLKPLEFRKHLMFKG